MKKVFLITILFAVSFVSCDEDGNFNWLSNDRNVAGLKQALTIGATNAAGTLGRENGFLGDEAVRILLPQEAQTALSTLNTIQTARAQLAAIPIFGGAIAEVIPNLSPNFDDILITAINRAAEHAAPQSVSVFTSAITNMSISDARNILFTDNHFAATDYLKVNTSEGLRMAFSPIIDDSLETVEVGDFTANSAWRVFADANNSLADFLDSSNPLLTSALYAIVPEARNINRVENTLGGHVTARALDGLFQKVAGEEYKIRTDVTARTTDLLRDVFGQLDR